MKTKTDHTPPKTHSNQFQLFHDSSRQQYGYVYHSLFHRTYCIFRRIYIIYNNCNFNLVYRYSLLVNVTLLQCNGYQMLQLQLFCAPEDGCWWCRKQVEQLSDKINSVICASYWDLCIRILLRCTDPWTL